MAPIVFIEQSLYLYLCLVAFVGRNVILTSGCIIGACCQVDTCEVITENTVIYGSDCLRRVQTERPQVSMNLPKPIYVISNVLVNFRIIRLNQFMCGCCVFKGVCTGALSWLHLICTFYTATWELPTRH